MTKQIFRQLPWLGLTIILIAGLYAIFYSQYVPTPLGTQSAQVFAILAGVVAGLVFLRGQRTFLPTRSIGALALLAIVLPVAYECFLGGIESWFTSVFGRFGEQVMVVSDWREQSRWHCAGPDMRGSFLLPPTLCLDHRLAAQSPAGRILILNGPATAFGINVRYVFKQD